jgi:hypothetical protein
VEVDGVGKFNRDCTNTCFANVYPSIEEEDTVFSLFGFHQVFFCTFGRWEMDIVAKTLTEKTSKI